MRPLTPRVTGLLRVTGLVLVGTAVGLLFLLRALPYSSCRLTSVTSTEAARPPTPDFSIGPLSWSVTRLKAEPALMPFRKSFSADCGSARGLQAAKCASISLARRSPMGTPAIEYVDRDFDPAEHLRQHNEGAPGHCLNRSAIVVTQLLSVGVPARVVQMVPTEGRGHTLVEVWDETAGWTVVDPTLGGVLSSQNHGGSAVDLLKGPAGLRWRPFPSGAFHQVDPRSQQRYFEGVLRGNLVYPEPWLYLRIGDRVAPWPFRGHFVCVGPTLLTLGPLQRTLTWAIPGFGLIGGALITLSRRRRDLGDAVASEAKG